MTRKDENGVNCYKDNDIFEGKIITKNRPCGYWSTKNSLKYPNPFYIKIVKHLWDKFDGLLFVCENFEINDSD